MKTIMNATSRPWRTACYVGLVLIGAWMGATIGTPNFADAGVRKGKEPEAFKSGGARSEVVLRDIAGILTRMDGRLARIEKMAGQATANQGKK